MKELGERGVFDKQETPYGDDTIDIMEFESDLSVVHDPVGQDQNNQGLEEKALKSDALVSENDAREICDTVSGCDTTNSDTSAPARETQKLDEPDSEDEDLETEVPVAANEAQMSNNEDSARNQVAVQSAFEDYTSLELDDRSSNSALNFDHSLASSPSASPRSSRSSQMEETATLVPTVSEESSSLRATKVPIPVQIEEVVDEDFVSEAHHNVDGYSTPELGIPPTENVIRDYVDDLGSSCASSQSFNRQTSEIPWTREQKIPQLQERSVSPVVPCTEPYLSAEPVELPAGLDGASSTSKIYLHAYRQWQPGPFNAFLMYRNGVWLQSNHFDDRWIFTVPECSEADSSFCISPPPSENEYGEFSDADCSEARWSTNANSPLVDISKNKPTIRQKRCICHWSVSHDVCQGNKFALGMSYFHNLTRQNLARATMITETHPHDGCALDFPQRRPILDRRTRREVAK